MSSNKAISASNIQKLNKSPSVPKLNFIQAWTITADMAFFRMTVHTHTESKPAPRWPELLWMCAQPDQVYVGEVKPEKVHVWIRELAYPETQTWILIMQMLHCKHRSLSAADGGGFTAAAARIAGGKRSEAPKSDRAATASLGHLIPPSHKGKRHAVEKNV